MDTPDIDQIFTWFSLSNSFDYTAHHAKTIYEYNILPLSNSSSESVIDPYISSKHKILIKGLHVCCTIALIIKTL